DPAEIHESPFWSAVSLTGGADGWWRGASTAQDPHHPGEGDGVVGKGAGCWAEELTTVNFQSLPSTTTGTAIRLTRTLSGALGLRAWLDRRGDEELG